MRWWNIILRFAALLVLVVLVLTVWLAHPFIQKKVEVEVTKLNIELLEQEAILAKKKSVDSKVSLKKDEEKEPQFAPLDPVNPADAALAPLLKLSELKGEPKKAELPLPSPITEKKAEAPPDRQSEDPYFKSFQKRKAMLDKSIEDSRAKLEAELAKGFHVMETYATKGGFPFTGPVTRYLSLPQKRVRRDALEKGIKNRIAAFEKTEGIAK